MNKFMPKSGGTAVRKRTATPTTKRRGRGKRVVVGATKAQGSTTHTPEPVAGEPLEGSYRVKADKGRLSWSKLPRVTERFPRGGLR